MSPPPGGGSARCCVCGDLVSGVDPEADVCCLPCYTQNFAGAVHLDPPVVRPTLGHPTREEQAVRNYQRHLQRVEGTGPCTPVVAEEDTP